MTRLPLTLCLLGALGGCEGAGSDSGWMEGAVLELDPWVVDLGRIASGSTESFELYAQSTGTEPVTILEIRSSDPRLVVDPAWQLHDCDADGQPDCQVLPAADSATDPAWSEPLLLRLEAGTPTTSPEPVEAEVIVRSTSELAHDFDEEGAGLTRLWVHVVVEDPCLQAVPAVADFVAVAPGESATETLALQSCAGVLATVEDLVWSGSATFSSALPLPLHVLPEGVEELPVTFAPTDAAPQAGSLTLDLGSASLEVPLSGNACPSSEADCRGSEWTDDDGDGLSEAEGDCDDADAGVYPGADELHDGIDTDCDGQLDEGSYGGDDDHDGYMELDSPSDCDDSDPWTHPGATEVCDGRDNDCDGLVDEGEGGEADGACALRRRDGG